MQCPNCGYSYIAGIRETVNGEFWELPIKSERNVDRNWGDNGERKSSIYGCPCCRILFLKEN